VAVRKLDRRILRTRKLLQDALVSLMIEKGYEATTVQDIIDRANVGRSTFYAHFADKETLLTSRLEDLRGMLAERQRQGAQRLGFSLPMLEHARDHLQLYKAIAGRSSGEVVIRRIHRMIAALAAIDLQATGVDRKSNRPALAAQFIAGAFMAVLIWWLEEDAKSPPAEVDTLFRQLVLRGLASELSPKPLPRPVVSR
jgi:AcrR family transcriptional regulator